MHHLIIGYGYCGYYLARLLLEKQQAVTAISRHLDSSMQLKGLTHQRHDLKQPLIWQKNQTVLYYLIPPPEEGEVDSLLEQFLAHSSIQVAKVIYFGSSAVYGDHQGAWVDEQTSWRLGSLRQQRRANAEQQWLQFCEQRAAECILLRIGGIFGPGRVPLEAAKSQVPLIEPKEAPYSNMIYVRDLANIAYQLAIRNNLAGIYNVADGLPRPMGALQQELAKILELPPAPYLSWEQAWQQASPLKREFMQASKCLRIEALKTNLKQSLHFTPFNEAIRDSLEGTPK